MTQVLFTVGMQNDYFSGGNMTPIEAIDHPPNQAYHPAPGVIRIPLRP